MTQTHHDIFVQHLAGATAEEQWVGFNIKNWWDYVALKLDQQLTTANLPDDKMTRTQLKEFCNADSQASEIECAAAVMAWGGQNRKHGITLFNRFEEIEPIIKDMRGGKINHLESYQRFYDIWKQPENLGMGAAYFTKLIFFCEPSHKGYIMDQWTSKSVNLLTGKDVIHLTAGYVNKKNTIDNYKNFCEYTESLASNLGTSGENVEIAMFSKGGRERWPWRQYVVDQMKP
jgi:hypothetical protein